MNLNEYQQFAVSTAFYPEAGEGSRTALTYCALGMNGEAGEVAEKIKKMIRDGIYHPQEILLEIGDVLWYCANMAQELGWTLEGIAEKNIKKLSSRKSRGTLTGNGDDR